MAAHRSSRPSPGERAEASARDYLLARGLRHVESNYRCRFGEIDLIMSDGESIVFVEVRYRRRDDFGGGAASVDRRKQGKLRATAEHFRLSRSALYSRPCRFDVVAVSGDLERGARIDWIKDAF